MITTVMIIMKQNDNCDDNFGHHNSSQNCDNDDNSCHEGSTTRTKTRGTFKSLFDGTLLHPSPLSGTLHSYNLMISIYVLHSNPMD